MMLSVCHINLFYHRLIIENNSKINQLYLLQDKIGKTDTSYIKTTILEISYLTEDPW